jgi:hypothetical protein
MVSSVADFKSTFNEKLNAKVTEMTSEFKDVAETSGWDSHVADAVTVGPIAFNIPDHAKEMVEDSEYGFDGSPAKAAMRKFTPAFQKHMSDAAGKAALEVLSVEGKELFAS